MSVWIHERSWPSIDAYLQENDTVLVPVGSTEQHGPHLPTGTDEMESISVAEGVAEELDLLVAPPLWYGDARHHLGYPGTLALRPETMVSVLRDIYDSLAHHGFEQIITVNGHRRANVPAVKTAMKHESEAHPDVQFAVADLIQIAVTAHEELRDGDPRDGTHGGEFETSFMLSEHPELVDREEFEPEIGTPVSDRVAVQSVDKSDTLEVASNWQSEEKEREEGHLGHSGDPTLATAEKGGELRRAMIDSIVEFIEDFEEE